jgi:uncharacterized integral membrane protein
MAKLIVSTLVLILLGVFIFLNSSQRVVLHLVFTQINDFPLAFACLLFFVLGLMLSIPFFLADRLALIKKHKLETKRLSAYLEGSRSELKELEKKVQSPQDSK